MANLESTDLQALSAGQIAALTTAGIVALDSTDIGNLSATQVAGMTTAQVRAWAG